MKDSDEAAQSANPGSAKRWITTTYIPPEGYSNLHRYQYKGQDKSLIYQHILTPMNKVLIEFFPTWMAPNLITMSGLLCVMLSHFIMWYYVPDLRGAAPPWVYLLNGAMLLVYQTLDNLDGRQARRIGASSPLGLFFDHGCDALNCTIGALTMMSATQMDSTWRSVVFFMSTIFLFFLNTWEEYYTGELILPIINGPTEGLLLGVGLHWWTAYAGPEWWRTAVLVPVHRPTALALGTWAEQYVAVGDAVEMVRQQGVVELDYSAVLVLIMLGCAVGTLLGNLLTVYRAVSRSGPRGHGKCTESWLTQNMPFTHACTRLVPFLAFSALATAWMAVSPTEILKRHPRLIFWTIGLLFAKLVTHMMIAHLCAVEYHPLRRTLMPFFFFAVHAALSWVNQRSDFYVNEELLVYEFFCLALMSYCHLVVGCVREFTVVLDIDCFRVRKRKT